MKTIPVLLKHHPYDIAVGTGILNQLGERVRHLNIGEDAIVITNPVIDRLYGKILRAEFRKAKLNIKVFCVPAGERSKSAKYAFALIEKIAKYDVFKKPFIVALGGGVVGDLAGYIASCYKRGIPFVQVPTTLLAQIDSAIGGKVAIDLPVGKNLVGAFYQPKLVFSDTSVLASLDQRQMLNGFAEAIKYGIISDKSLFDYIARNHARLSALEPKAVERVVMECSRIKANVVAEDEFEKKGLRTILNFGHTAGHAVEAAAAYNQYHHGEAVALGMRAAIHISVALGLCKASDSAVMNQVFDDLGLPRKIKKITPSKIMSLMKRDKKFLHGKNRFVLVKSIGQVKVVEGIPETVIKNALKNLT